jgi:hypothetical protein
MPDQYDPLIFVWEDLTVIERREEAEAKMIAGAADFTVCWFRGRESGKTWEIRYYPTLAAAYEARDAEGKDKQGRQGIIYAIAPDTRTIHIG